MRKYIALTGAAALACALLSTTASAGGFYVGPSLGYYHADAERTLNDDNNSTISAALNLGYRFSGRWALELSQDQDASGSDLEKSDLSVYFYGGDSGEYLDQLHPYGVIGVSRYRSDAVNIAGGYDDTWQAQLGVGLSRRYQNNLEVRGDIRMYPQARHGRNGESDALDLGFNLALLKHFGDAPARPAEPEVEPEPQVAPEPIPEPEAEPEVRTITVRLNVEFEFDSDVVRAIYGDELEAIANAMKVHEDIALVLEGHTDARGSDEYNQSLSRRRAEAVRAALSKTYGIEASRISAVGYGESRPVASNDTAEGRQRNRRVVGEMSYTEVVPE